jgi:2-polyprenyl-3-methyl-5-hydroxy-6-metoxy-1,4-benzoquinol methylase
MATLKCPVCLDEWSGKRTQLQSYELLSCSKCGLWFYDPRKQSGIDYDEVYKMREYKEVQLDSLDDTIAWHDFAEMPTYKPFFLNIQNIANTKLLDIGCGVGRFCRAAYSLGWDVTGIDISKTAILSGKKTVPFPMFNLSVEDIIARNEVFHVVTAFEVLEHIIEPLIFLSKISRTIKPGGSFFCTVPNRESPTIKKNPRKDWLPPIHLLFFTEYALRELLINAGFKNIRTGIIWVNKPSTFSGIHLLRYCLKRIKNPKYKPDPLGLWATGNK